MHGKVMLSNVEWFGGGGVGWVAEQVGCGVK